MKLLHVGLSANGFPYNGLQKALSERFTYKELHTSTPDLNSEIITACDEFKPSIVFMQIQQAAVVNKDTLDKISESVDVIFNWTGDVRHPIPEWYKDLGGSCITLFSNMTDVNLMRGAGAFRTDYLQIGYDPEIYTPIGASFNVPDIVFLGNNYGTGTFPLSEERITMVSKMREVFGSRFGVYGNNWDNANGEFNNDQYAEAAVYRGSEIAINFSHFNYDMYSSDRLFRILGSGALCFTHKFVGMEKMGLLDGKNVVAFESVDELIDKCKFYLNNRQLRHEIAREGNQLALERYTFEKMSENIETLYYKWT